MNGTYSGPPRPHVSVGCVYSILTFEGAYLRIVDDGGAPSLFEFDHWTIQPQLPPRDWVVQVGDGELSLGPAPLLAPGFFEDVFDRRTQELTAFLEGEWASAAELERFSAWAFTA